MTLNWRTDNENMIYLQNLVLLSKRGRETDILKFAYKWMELEKNISSELTQTQKDEHGIYSLISGY